MSDHTEDVGKYSKKRAINRERQDQAEMSQEDISQYMMKAFDQRFPVTIQLRNHTNENFKNNSNNQQRKSTTVQPFQKDNHGNFEKSRHANGIDNKSKDNQQINDGNKKRVVYKKAVAPMGKINKIAKKMTQQGKQEIQQVHRMLQGMDDSMSQTISDESLSRHI